MCAVMRGTDFKEGQFVGIRVARIPRRRDGLRRLALVCSSDAPAFSPGATDSSKGRGSEKIETVWVEGSAKPVPRRGNEVTKQLTGEMIRQLEILKRFVQVRTVAPGATSSGPATRSSMVHYIVIPKIKRSPDSMIRGAGLTAAADVRGSALERFATLSGRMIEQLERHGRVRIKETPGLASIGGAAAAQETQIVVRPLPLLNAMLIAGPPEIRSTLESDDVEYVVEAAELKFRVPDPNVPTMVGGKPRLWHLEQLPEITRDSHDSNDESKPWIGIADSGIGMKLRNGPEFSNRTVEFAEFDSSGNQVPSAPHRDVSPKSHGSSVAALAAGNNYGVAKNANLAVALCLDHNLAADDPNQVIEALNWLVGLLLEKGGNAVKVINCSFTAGTGANSLPSLTFESVINTIRSMGVCVVSAIGNMGAGTHGSPANYVGVIGVGAVDKHGQLASFSSHGYVNRTNGSKDFKPDFVTYGVDVPTLTRDHLPCHQTGTSFASPIIAGYATKVAGSGVPGASVHDQVVNALRGLGMQITIGKRPHRGDCYRL